MEKDIFGKIIDSATRVPRFAMSALEAGLIDSPVVLIHGPRQCGKTTLAKQAAAIHGHTYLSFDDENLLRFAKEDPVRFCLELPDKVVLDEVQRVPELFRSIKLAIDVGRTNGRFILTGSANILTLPKLSDSLAGRMSVVELESLSQAELESVDSKRPQSKVPDFLERLFRADFPIRTSQRVGDSNLIGRVLSGGFPGSLVRDTFRRRREWQESYIRTVTERDIRDLARIQAMDAIPRLLQFVAAQSAQLLNVSKLATGLALSRPTVESYLTLLQRLFLIHLLPAWSNNRQSRLVKTPKIHLSDCGLASAVLKTDLDALKVTERTLFGHLLETLVYHELRCLNAWSTMGIQYFHFRDKDAYEVDFVLEGAGKRIAGVEVKAASTLHPRDFNGLRRLKQLAGNKFACGVVLYDGETPLPADSDLYAVPIHTLWMGLQ